MTTKIEGGTEKYQPMPAFLSKQPFAVYCENDVLETENSSHHDVFKTPLLPANNAGGHHKPLTEKKGICVETAFKQPERQDGHETDMLSLADLAHDSSAMMFEPFFHSTKRYSASLTNGGCAVSMNGLESMNSTSSVFGPSDFQQYKEAVDVDEEGMASLQLTDCHAYYVENKKLSPIFETSHDNYQTDGSRSNSSRSATSSSRSSQGSTADTGAILSQQISHPSNLEPSAKLAVVLESDESLIKNISSDVEENPAYVSDPFDDNLISGLLSCEQFDKMRHECPHSVCINGVMPKIRSCSAVVLADDGVVFDVKKCIAEGGYAKVYMAVEKNELVKSSVALKVQAPPCPWELYICMSLQKRLLELGAPQRILESVMTVNRSYFYDNSSILVSDFCKMGSLLNLINRNKARLDGKGLLPECVMAYLTTKILDIVRYVHSCSIIHADIKPDNFLLVNVDTPVSDSDHCRPVLRLTDFGRSIDMTMFPPRAQFTHVFKTHASQTPEMRNGQPWTYQLDMYGLCATIVCLMTGNYMCGLYEQSGRWRWPGKIPRGWNSLWIQFINSMLNIPSCSELPNLDEYSREFRELVDLPAVYAWFQTVKMNELTTAFNM